MSEETQEAFPITDYNALNSIPTGVGVYDVTGDRVVLRYMNDGYYQMLGTKRGTRSVYMGDRVMGAIHPDDRPCVLKEARDSVREKRMFSQRFRVLGGDGAYIWIGIRANHMALDAETERFFASYYNIDDYISRQLMLETSSNHLNEILESVPGGIAIFSYRGGEIRLEYANNGFYELHHGSREFWQSKSQNPVDWLLPEDKNIFWSAFARVHKEKQPLGSAEYRITGGDGAPHWLGIHFRFAYLRDGVPYFYASFTNLDELKAAEQSLSESRRIYEAAVEESNLVVWEYDIPNHRIIMAENEFTRYDYRKFGLPKITENAPQSLLPYIDDAYEETFLEMYRRIDAGAPRASCEVWYKLKPGTEPRCEHISYTTVFDGDGRPVKAYGIGRNITRQKLAQEDYDRMREQLTGNLTDVVGSFQLNLSQNKYLSGYSPAPWVVKTLARETADGHFAATAATVANDRIREEILRDYTCENLVKLFKSGCKQLERDYPVRSSSGGILWIHSTLHMMQNPNTGNIEGITYSKDNTGHKRDGEIIQKLSSAGCDYIGVLDAAVGTFEMHTLNWDCGALPAGQKTDYDAIRTLLSNGYIPSDKRPAFLADTSLKAVAAALGEKAQHIVAYDFADQSGPNELFKKQIIFSWLNDLNREILCIQQDVTEAYQKEQEQIAALKKAKCEADAANEAKSVFLSGMSHDLRTPLNGVLGFTAFALKEQDQQKKQEYLEKIEASGKLLLDLINDTLELSRIESGKAVLEPEAVLQSELIPAVATALRPSAELKGVGYRTDFEIDGSALVWCDKLKIQKIALNLISNAIKYTPEGGSVTIALKTVPADGGDNFCCLTVADTGIGMSGNFMKRMYEPFVQEMRSEAVKSPGTGLGLAIVKKYVDLMGGSIEAESSLHKGTRFTVLLPVSPVCTEADMKDPGKEEASLQLLSGRRILLCEDNYMNTEIAVMLLKERGMTAETAENGREGLEKFAASDAGWFDAVLMDLRMPVMDGCETARRIRALVRPDAKDVPIVAMTADAFEESVRESREAGMDGYVTKPVDPRALYAALVAAISRRRQTALK